MLTIYKLPKWPPLQTDVRERVLVQPRWRNMCTRTVYGQTVSVVAQTATCSSRLEEIDTIKTWQEIRDTSVVRLVILRKRMRSYRMGTRCPAVFLKLPFVPYIVYTRRQQRLWRDCANALPRPNRCCSSMIHTFFAWAFLQYVFDRSAMTNDKSFSHSGHRTKMNCLWMLTEAWYAASKLLGRYNIWFYFQWYIILFFVTKCR